MGNTRAGSPSYSSSPSIFLRLSAMHFLPRLSATSSLLLSRASEGAVGLQEPGVVPFLRQQRGAGNGPLAPTVHGCSRGSLSSHSTCQPLTQASSQHTPLPSVRAAAGGALPKWLAAGKKLTPEKPAPDVHSCVHAAAVPPRAVPGCLWRNTEQVCWAGVTSMPVVGLCGQSYCVHPPGLVQTTFRQWGCSISFGRGASDPISLLRHFCLSKLRFP